MFIEISLCGSVMVMQEDGGSISDPTQVQALLDCVAGGDCEPACQHVLSAYDVSFNIVARCLLTGEYKNRVATDKELQQVCETIYFESESDFSDPNTAKGYLVWEAAPNFEYERETI